MRVWGKDRAFACITVLLFCFTTTKFYSFMQTNKAYVLRFSPQISTQFKDSVKSYFKKNISDKNFNSISKDLLSNFNLIKSVKIQKDNPFRARININCFSPKLKIQVSDFIQHNLDKSKDIIFFILATNDTLFSPDVFDNYVVPSLKLHDVAEVKLSEFKKFVDIALDNQIFDLYEVEWVTKNYIVMHNKTNKHINFVTKYDRLPSFKDIDLIEKFIEEKKGSKGTPQADLRFAGQVVISFV